MTLLLSSRTIWWSRHGATNATQDLTATSEAPRLLAAGATINHAGRIVSPSGAELEPSRAFGDWEFKVCIFTHSSFTV